MEIINYLGKGSGFTTLLAVMTLFLILTIFLISKSSKKIYMGRLLIPIIFIELALVFGIITLGFPDKGDDVGPGVVPLLWLIGILGLSIFLFVKGILGYEEVDPPWGKIGKVFVFIGMILLYLVFMQVIGYTIATILYLISSMYYLSYRNWKVMITLTTGWVLFSYFIFYRLLYVPLPKGILIEWIFG